MKLQLPLANLCFPSPFCSQLDQRAAMKITISQHPHLTARAIWGRWDGSEPSAPTPQAGAALSSARRDAETGYHRVLSRYRPEEPAGPEVAAGSLVFVLSRAADGCATAIHDGQVRTRPVGDTAPWAGRGHGPVGKGKDTAPWAGEGQGSVGNTAS